MRIAFIGYGNVGASLANKLERLGHEVTLAAHDPASEKLKKAQEKNPNLKSASPREAVGGAELIFLATPFQVNAEVLQSLNQELKGKILVDCTNPIGSKLSHGLNSVQSGAEAVQKMVPDTKVVKAFNTYGFENFENNIYPAYNVKPVMMFCGNDADAKEIVGGLIAQLGWEPLDVGGLDQALHLEHMTLLWVRMVRVHGYSPNMVWARLKR